MGEHQNKPPIPQQRNFNFPSQASCFQYVLLDRITTDLQAAENNLTFLKRAMPTEVDDEDIKGIHTALVQAILHREAFYAKINSRIQLAKPGDLPPGALIK